MFVLPWNPVMGRETWRDLIVAPKSRCSVYDPADCPYPQSIEDKVIGATGALFASCWILAGD